mgnify:CR=1 FL=1|jgi:hypothetical protein
MFCFVAVYSGVDASTARRNEAAESSMLHFAFLPNNPDKDKQELSARFVSYRRLPFIEVSFRLPLASCPIGSRLLESIISDVTFRRLALIA